VPVAYAHHKILAKGYVDRVVLCHEEKIVAEHRRSWGKEGLFCDFRHYLPLLERKPGALDDALPLAGLDFPKCFETLRRRLIMEEEKEGEGTREFIKVLRLLEDYPMANLKQAVEKGLSIRAHQREAISMFLIPPQPYHHPVFRLDGREHLAWVKVASPDISAYRILLEEGGTL
jgi:hypothetical protein